MPRQSAATPPIRLPAIWPMREEDRVEAHDRAAIGREALGDVGEQAERGGRRAGEHEQAGPPPARRPRPAITPGKSSPSG